MKGDGDPGIELIARGACVCAGRLLLCHSVGKAHTFLPGGHVEFGEGAAESLRREIDEELGLASTVGEFLGAVEHTFVQKGRAHCEVNLVFRLEIAGADGRRAPRSLESGIDFRWAAVGRLAAARLEPAVLQTLLPRWLRRRGVVAWGSNY